MYINKEKINKIAVIKILLSLDDNQNYILSYLSLITNQL